LLYNEHSRPVRCDNRKGVMIMVNDGPSIRFSACWMSLSYLCVSCAFCLLHVGLLLGLFVDPEDGGDIFHQIVDFQWAAECYIPDDRSLQNLY
jgi:hypothetical protein